MRHVLLSVGLVACILLGAASLANAQLTEATLNGKYKTLDLTLTRSFSLGGHRELQLRADIYNVLNTLNLFLPNADLSISNFGKSTQAFDPRMTQVGLRLVF